MVKAAFNQVAAAFVVREGSMTDLHETNPKQNRHYWLVICRLCCRCHRPRCDGYCVAHRGTGRLAIVLSQ